MKKFPGTEYQELIYKRSYSRWLDAAGRREELDESVNRYYEFMLEHLGKLEVKKRFLDEFLWACSFINTLDVMPSMRALWTAGPALERENVAGYNCAYLEIAHPKKFAELLYVLMNGTGIGFSVERQVVQNLPHVPAQLTKVDQEIVFADSKKGWAEGLYSYLKSLWSGNIPKYNLSNIRPKGARLKTFGGRASGPEPLQELLEYCKALFMPAAGRQLNSLECHDLCCRIASVVMVGGVRRSACISLSNLSDDRLAKAKSGDWWTATPYRQYANNSVAYTEKPGARKFLSEWLKLVESQSGERGLFNRPGADFSAMKTGRRATGYNWGLNPCGEIILRPDQFCNLTEVVVKPEDDLITLMGKVRAATILGVVQSTLTDFKFLSRSWKKNCEEERLLGVSLTGLADNTGLYIHQPSNAAWVLHQLKEEAIRIAREWSSGMNIPMPAAITCVKPSGTVSQLVGSSSGLHPRYSPYYIRRVQIAADDPMSKLLIQSGAPHHPAPNENPDNPSTWAFEFPIQSPLGSVYKDEVTALQQLEYWKILKENWTEHNPSCTIYVRDEEWPEVGAWVYKNWHQICGLSFLPVDSNIYVRPPYEEIDDDTFEKLNAEFPDIDFSKLSEFEKQDNTEGSREFACTSGNCEL